MRKAILLFIAATATAQVPDGDQHFATRAEGHQGGHAQAAHVDAAIAAYRQAIAQNPNDLEPRWKLLRAIRFKGAYVATTNDAKRPIYAQGKKAGQEALAVVARQPHALRVAEVYLWDSVNWGEWALAYGKMAAVREGAADRIKREATIAMQMDPRVEGGAPARVRGRPPARGRCSRSGAGKRDDVIPSVSEEPVWAGGARPRWRAVRPHRSFAHAQDDGASATTTSPTATVSTTSNSNPCSVSRSSRS